MVPCLYYWGVCSTLLFAWFIFSIALPCFKAFFVITIHLLIPIFFKGLYYITHVEILNNVYNSLYDHNKVCLDSYDIGSAFYKPIVILGMYLTHLSNEYFYKQSINQKKFRCAKNIKKDDEMLMLKLKKITCSFLISESIDSISSVFSNNNKLNSLLSDSFGPFKELIYKIIIYNFVREIVDYLYNSTKKAIYIQLKIFNIFKEYKNMLLIMKINYSFSPP